MNTLTPRAAFVLSSEPHCSHCMIGKNGCPSSRNCFDEEMLDLRAGGGRGGGGGGVTEVVTTSCGALAAPYSFAVKSIGVVAELVNAKLYVPSPVTSGVTSIDTQVLTANEPTDDVTVDEYAGLLFQF